MRKLFPGAAFGLALVLATSGMSRDVINGWQPRHRTRTTTTEPMSTFWECYFFPWISYCRIPDPPKTLQPDVPAGCCSDTCMGPCQ